jgi:hypothetical protein
LLFIGDCSAVPSEPYRDYVAQGDSQFFVHPATWGIEVAQVAMRYCANRGKTAVVQHQAPYGDHGLRQTNYLCR